ncbi:MAG: TetR/AcrR family transcriptional regulator [Rhodococcus sp. (in: high G+C Gram-positive bacteria)]
MSGAEKRQTGTIKRGRPPEHGLADRRRQQLVSCAAEVFAERGYERTTVTMLARRAGVGQGTVYRYFDSKRDLFDSVFDHATEHLFASMDTTVLLEPIDSVQEFLSTVTRLGDDMFALMNAATPYLKLILVEAVAVDEEMTRRVGGVQQIVMSIIATALEQGKDRGWVRREVDTELVSVAMAALALPAMLRGLQGKTAPSRNSGALVLLARGVAVRR